MQRYHLPLCSFTHGKKGDVKSFDQCWINKNFRMVCRQQITFKWQQSEVRDLSKTSANIYRIWYPTAHDKQHYHQEGKLIQLSGFNEQQIPDMAFPFSQNSGQDVPYTRCNV